MSANQPTNQPDRVNKTNKQTTRWRMQFTFWMSKTPETEDFLRRAQELMDREKWGVSDLARAAVTEYVDRHYPGNPTPPLTTYFPNAPPLSIAAREKLSPQTPSAGRVYQVRCRFCREWFETTEDMATPTCPRCTKPPEAPAV